jgi:site-specific recombinase XerD
LELVDLLYQSDSSRTALRYGGYPLRNFGSIAVLRSDLAQQPPATQRLRLALEKYLSGMRMSTRKHSVIRFRRLAHYMKLDRDSWPIALDRFFAMPLSEAELFVDRYTAWAQSRNAKLRGKGGFGGFVGLTTFVRSEGASQWVIKQSLHRRSEREWMDCPPQFRDPADEWLRLHRARRLNEATLARYLVHLKSLARFLERRKVNLLTMTYDHAVAWLEETTEAGHVAEYVNSRLSTGRRFCDWLLRRKLIAESPFVGIDSLRARRQLPKSLDEKEVLRVIRACTLRRDRAILEVLYASGCRAAELTRLDLANISFSERTARTIGKGNDDRLLYLNRQAVSAIRRYLPERALKLHQYGRPDEPALFLTFRGVRMNPGSVCTTVKQIARKAGFQKPVYPHLFRHSFATHLLNRGADLYSLMQLLGHKTLEATQIYLHIATRRLHRVYRRYHPRK